MCIRDSAKGVPPANILELPAGQTRGGYIELTVTEDK